MTHIHPLPFTPSVTRVTAASNSVDLGSDAWNHVSEHKK